ncbi:hypothetical protein [Humisphaera borealis]|uniref:DUF4139 domain-containing protein n=1 Tax=Humisphaera borealis TaxID=2807512 RepID=A0A7M2WTU3_9BACT|nr:hypothetical protein [Humisphaera borealis]QOV88873.1 hypothetical protein IPV69_22005 [Humisphaera borealis]
MVRTRCEAAVVLCAIVTWAGGALAQPAQPPSTQPVVTPSAPFALPALGGTTVAIPWPELAALLERAGDRAAKPPVDFVFAPATYTARPVGSAIEVIAEVQATLLRNDFALLPVAPADVAVESVTVDGQPAALVMQGKTLSAFVTGGGRKSLRVTLTRPIVSQDGSPRFDLPLADWPISNVKFSVPGSVEITASGAASAISAEAGGTTTLTATYRGGAVAAIAWKPRAAQADVAAARIYGDSETRISVRRGLVRYQTAIHLNVERGTIPALKLTLDPKAVVLSVGGKDVAGYQEAAAAAAGKPVTINFARPIGGKQDIELVYEKDVAEAGGAERFVAPAIDGARRDGGVIAIDSDGAYDVRPAPAGGAAEATLERLGVSELPQSFRTPATTLAYRYGSPAATAVALTPIKPQPAKVAVLTQTRVAVDRGVLRCQASVTYEILHAGVDTFRINLPKGAELIAVEGEGVRDTQVVDENGARIVVVGLKDVARKQYALTLTYDVAFAEKAIAVAGQAMVPPAATRPATQPAGDAVAAAATISATVVVPILSHPDASTARGYIGVEVRGGYEVTTSVTGAERIDVKELPRLLWSMARSPVLEGYRYDSGVPAMTLAIARHQDLDVLVAMADVCEASTTVTADGRSVTKLMYIVRNNLKPSMTLRLPAGAEVWSTFVDDKPVTPAKTADGRVLIPLKRSEEVEDGDDESYQFRRDRRRQGEEHRVIKEMQQKRTDDELAGDLKPYDVEVVYVMPAVKLADRGQLELSLPQSDVPVGHLAWAVFLPKQYRVVDAQGNVSEVSRFTLPFRHFGEAALARTKEVAELQKASQQLAQAHDAAKAFAEASKVAGVLPVRVEIPIAGEITRFEKLLLVDEMPKTTVGYSRKLE